jgi:hypothetical protein
MKKYLCVLTSLCLSTAFAGTIPALHLDCKKSSDGITTTYHCQTQAMGSHAVALDIKNMAAFWDQLATIATPDCGVGTCRMHFFIQPR